MEAGQLHVRCVCGWEAIGPADEIVLATQEHGRRLHNMEASPEDVLAMAVATRDDASPAAGSPS